MMLPLIEIVLVEKWKSYQENSFVHYFLTVALCTHLSVSSLCRLLVCEVCDDDDDGMAVSQDEDGWGSTIPVSALTTGSGSWLDDSVNTQT